MEKSIVVCKCEEINIDKIKSAIKIGAHTFDDIKRLTICGKGPCQAKVCTNLVRQIIRDCTNKPLSEIKPSKMRLPLTPTRIGVLAGRQGSSSVLSVFSETATVLGDSRNE